MSEELLTQYPIPKNNVDNHNPMKKSDSMGNPSSEKVENNDSEDDAEDLADGVSQRKRWTEEEHKIFLIGLKKLGRGDWKGISQKFVTTRSPSQVASHAQKYFLRKATIDKKKPRSSVFDVSLTEPHSRASISARMSLNLKLDILIPTPEQRYPLRRQEP
ncbi:hypothetical protein CMV_021265 [Castanea mollissima]|uniref:MYB transcription factor n=1 Tax=Castanea mollissima TaxID=60419 RepID=A0A8J4VKT4_9ROSI|nr:hypothetical protein CMV_021265 [Castanea mollissima]